MSSEVLVVLAVVLPDEPTDEPDTRTQILDLRGRELPGVPGSWISQVAVHPYPRAHVGSTISGRDDPDPGQVTGDELDHELDLDYGISGDDA